jgi:hypothetical protein
MTKTQSGANFLIEAEHDMVSWPQAMTNVGPSLEQEGLTVTQSIIANDMSVFYIRGTRCVMVTPSVSLFLE